MTDTDLFTTSDSDVTVAPQVVVETTDAPATGASRRGRGGSLTSMLLPDLRTLANEVGVKGTSGMRKGDLISAIKEVRGQSGGAAAPAAQPQAAAPAPVAEAAADAPPQAKRPRRERSGASRNSGAPAAQQESQDAGETKQDDAEAKTQNAPSQDAPAKDTTPREEAKSGSNPQLKQFALDTLPTLKQHLTDVEGLAHSGHGSGA